MSRFDSFELTAFNLERQINLGEKYGLIKILKSDDGKIVLVCDGEYGTLDQIQPTQLSVANPDAALGLVLDIGIRRDKQLTIGGGFYAALPLMTVQSNRPIKQADFDEGLFEQIKANLDRCFQSRVHTKELLAIRLNQLIETYNNSRLLFPNFHNESYLGLMRIIDAIGQTWGADDFALAAASISATLNEDICDKIKKINAYGPRIQIALGLFDERLLQVSKALRGSMASLDLNGFFRNLLGTMSIGASARLCGPSHARWSIILITRVTNTQPLGYFRLLAVQFGRIAQIYGHVSVKLTPGRIRAQKPKGATLWQKQCLE
jgi:hypothetical protein